MLEESAVLTLVNKKSRFLTLEPVYIELQTVFQSYVAVIVSDEVFIVGIKMSLVGESGVAFVLYVTDAGFG